MEYLKNGQIHTALTEGYSSEGYGVVRLDGTVVFVPRAVRGERIDLRITRVMKTHALGEIVKIHTPPRSGPSRTALITAGAAAATSAISPMKKSCGPSGSGFRTP